MPDRNFEAKSSSPIATGRRLTHQGRNVKEQLPQPLFNQGSQQTQLERLSVQYPENIETVSHHSTYGNYLNE